MKNTHSKNQRVQCIADCKKEIPAILPKQQEERNLVSNKRKGSGRG